MEFRCWKFAARIHVSPPATHLMLSKVGILRSTNKVWRKLSGCMVLVPTPGTAILLEEVAFRPQES